MSRTKLIYVGNQLSGHGFTPTSIETLGEKLGDDFEVIRASSFKNVVFRMLDIWKTILKHRKADYLLIDTYSTSAFFFAWTSARLARCFGLKYIPILHGGDLPKRIKNSPVTLLKYLKEAHAVVCPSGYLKSEMSNFLQRDYHLISNFIDIGYYPYQLKTLSPGDPIRLLWLRSFHQIYNPDLAVQVLKGLFDLGHDVHLCMVGPDKDGSMERVRELARQLDVFDRLEITGRMSRADWIALSGEYNVFINTTDVDNTPVSIMEAMALGFPIVTTNVGGMPHLLVDQKEGVLVPAGSLDKFVMAINNLINKPEKALQMGQNARRTAELWDWQVIRQAWLTLLKSTD